MDDYQWVAAGLVAAEFFALLPSELLRARRVVTPRHAWLLRLGFITAFVAASIVLGAAVEPHSQLRRDRPDVAAVFAILAYVSALVWALAAQALEGPVPDVAVGQRWRRFRQAGRQLVRDLLVVALFLLAIIGTAYAVAQAKIGS